MRNIPMGEFKDNASAWIAAAEAGEEIVITRHGKPAAKLTGIVDDDKAAQRKAVDELIAMGREQRAKYGSVSIDEIIAWKNEGRR